MDDHSEMPFGKYRGEKMANISAEYLLYLHGEGICHGEVKEYIEDNLEVLKKQVEYNNKKGK